MNYKKYEMLSYNEQLNPFSHTKKLNFVLSIKRFYFSIKKCKSLSTKQNVTLLSTASEFKSSFRLKFKDCIVVLL
jgi:hypothetical protein